jgi:FAD:protein FMN transferase
MNESLEMSRRKTGIWIGAMALFLAALFYFSRDSSNSGLQQSNTIVRRSFKAMATTITVAAYSHQAEQAFKIVAEIFHDVDQRMSEWKPRSPIGTLNRVAGSGRVKLPDDLYQLVQRGVELGKMTEGAFDVSWAALWGVWDFRAEKPRVPSAESIAEKVALIDYRKIVLDEKGKFVSLSQKGMKIGLGGIAKGYALDIARERLGKAGIKDFLISGGGQVCAGGQRNGRNWRVGIRDPRGPRDDYLAKLDVSDRTVSTSGDYERFFLIDGIRYHHIIDPRTGYPSKGLRSVSVIAADATLADALSTAAMILGKEKSLKLAGSLPGVELIMVDREGKLSTTPGVGADLQIVHSPRP